MTNELQTETPEETPAEPQDALPGAAPEEPSSLRLVVEALLFAAPKPLTPRQIANLLNKSNETHGADFHLFREVAEERIEEVVAQLAAEYAESARGLVVQQIAGGYRLGTRPEAATWVRQLFDETRPAKLSQPALETLSIIAYRQPISRADIEAVRGVAVDGVVTTLLERRLIKLAGRSEAPGRPLLYETTHEFLECFGLRHLDELPNADELRHIQIRPPQAAEEPSAAPAESTEPQATVEEAVSEAPEDTPAEVENEEWPVSSSESEGNDSPDPIPEPDSDAQDPSNA